MSERDQLQLLNAQLTEQLHQLYSERAGLVAQHNRLESQIDMLLSQTNKLQEQNGAYSRQNTGYSRQNSGYSRQNDKLTQLLSDALRRLEDASKQVSTIQNDVEKTASPAGASGTQPPRSPPASDEIHDELKSVKMRLVEISAAYKEAKEALNRKSGEIKTLRCQLAEIERIEATHVELESVKNQLSKISTSYEKANEELRRKSGEIKTLKSQLAKVKRIEAGYIELESVKMQLTKITTAHEEARQDLRGKSGEIETLRDQLTEAKRIEAEQLLALKTATTNNEELSRSNEILTGETSSLRREISNFNDLLENQKSRLTTYVTTGKKDSREKELRRKLEAANQKALKSDENEILATAAAANAERLREENQKLEGNLAELKKSHAKLLVNFAKLKKIHFEDLKNRYETSGEYPTAQKESLDLSQNSSAVEYEMWRAFRSELVDSLKALLEKGAKLNTKFDSGMTPLHYAALTGDVKMLTFVLEQLEKDGDPPINATNHKGDTALGAALRDGLLDSVKLLIEHKADPTVSNHAGEDGLMLATTSESTDIFKFIFESLSEELRHAIFKRRREKDDRTVLHLAAALRRMDIVDLIVGYCDPNSLDSRGETPLHVALGNFNPEIVSLLIAKGADPDFKDADGRTATDILEDMYESWNNVQKAIDRAYVAAGRPGPMRASSYPADESTSQL